MARRPWTVIVVGIALGLPTATAAAAAPVEQCTTTGPLSDGYRALKLADGPAVKDVSYEIADNGRDAQRTLYLPGGAYLATICGPGDTVAEQVVARMPLSDGSTQYRVLENAERKNGEWRVFHPTLPNPVDRVPELANPRLRTQWNRILENAAVAATEGRDGRIKPGDKGKLTPRMQRATSSAKSAKRVKAKASQLGNKCVHNMWGASYPFYQRNYTFWTALGGATWFRTRYGDAVGTWTGLFNTCGLIQGYQRVFAQWLGDIPNFFPVQDVQNQVGFWWGWDNNLCGSTLAIGCAIDQAYTWDGGKWTKSEVDVWFHAFFPWSVDGGCSAGNTVDFWGVAAHEIGHVYGALDLPASVDPWAQDLVMATPADWCTIPLCQARLRR